MFDATKEDLKDLLKKADQGKLQLPEFQRSYVWNDADLRSLLASVLKGFPVGALLTLEAGGTLRFKPRCLEGVETRGVEPSELLLDGQQRMTSLYQSTFCQKPVRTRTTKNIEVDRYYYLKIEDAINSEKDIEDSILSLPADRIVKENFAVKLDLSSQEKEFDEDCFPLNQIFDASRWLYEWTAYWKAKGVDKFDIQRKFDQDLIDRFIRYKMPIIRLDKENTREAICTVFEKVNVGGKKLDAFELVTAIFAGSEEGFDLRTDWDCTIPGKPGRRQRIIGLVNRRDVLSRIAHTDFLQACTLLHTRQVRLEVENEVKALGATTVDIQGKGRDLPAISCKREALLALPLHGYKEHSPKLEAGFVRAAAFLNEQKIIWHKDVPYPPQLVALAAVHAVLGAKADQLAAKEKLAQWFWCVTFGELYGSSTESRLAKDVPELIAWIETGKIPTSVGEALFQRDRLQSLRSRQSAAYKGAHALMMRNGCLDFMTGKPTDIMTFFNDEIDIHHVFPQKWCHDNGIDPYFYNSIVNKTPLSKRSNIVIGGSAPSEYIKKIEEEGISSESLDKILRSHLIEPSFLRADDFEGFFKDRQDKLSAMIGSAMGKNVVDSDPSGEVGKDVSDLGDGVDGAEEPA